jgi:hypothetical protein
MYFYINNIFGFLTFSVVLKKEIYCDIKYFDIYFSLKMMASWD